jgi:hypothetical protein
LSCQITTYYVFNGVFSKLPTYTLAGFDLTTHSSNLLVGRHRRCHYICRPCRQGNFLTVFHVIRPIAQKFIFISLSLSFSPTHTSTPPPPRSTSASASLSSVSCLCQDWARRSHLFEKNVPVSNARLTERCARQARAALSLPWKAVAGL